MPSPTQAAIAQAVRIVRARRNIPHESTLARTIGVSTSWLNKRMNGDLRMSLDDVEAIATALGMTPWELLDVARDEATISA